MDEMESVEAPDPRDIEWSVETIKCKDGRALLRIYKADDGEGSRYVPIPPEGLPLLAVYESLVING